MTMENLGSKIDKLKQDLNNHTIQEETVDADIKTAKKKKDALAKEVADIELFNSLKAQLRERQERLTTKKTTLVDLYGDIDELSNKRAKVCQHILF